MKTNIEARVISVSDSGSIVEIETMYANPDTRDTTYAWFSYSDRRAQMQLTHVSAAGCQLENWITEAINSDNGIFAELKTAAYAAMEQDWEVKQELARRLDDEKRGYPFSDLYPYAA